MSAPAAAAASAATAPRQVLGAFSDIALRTRTLNLSDAKTRHNFQNKWHQFLYKSNVDVAAKILIYLDPLSGAQCSLSCKHWHVLRTSNAVSRWLIYAHFGLLFRLPQEGQKVEGTYWSRYRAFGEIYPNVRRFAFQPPTIVDFSKPSTPVENVSAPAMLTDPGSLPRFLMKSSLIACECDALMVTTTSREILDEVHHVRRLQFTSNVQIRNPRNECYFQGEQLGKITSIATSDFAPLVAAGMDDGDLVLWDIRDGQKLARLPYQPTEPNPSNPPLPPPDPTLNLEPLTKALQSIFFIDTNMMRTAHRDGTTCMWTWNRNEILKKWDFKAEAYKIPHFQIIKTFTNRIFLTSVVYGRWYTQPYHYSMFVFNFKQPRDIVDLGPRPLNAITFFSNTSIVCAFPGENNVGSYISVYDLPTQTWNYLVNDIARISNLALCFNDRVLAMSTYERNPETQNIEAFVSLFDIPRGAFIRHAVQGPNDFAMLPPGINDSTVVFTNPSPSFLTVAERISKRVFFYNFMSQGSAPAFAINTTIPLRAKVAPRASFGVASGPAPAAGAGAGIGGLKDVLNRGASPARAAASAAQAAGAGAGAQAAAAAGAQAQAPPAAVGSKRKNAPDQADAQAVNGAFAAAAAGPAVPQNAGLQAPAAAAAAAVAQNRRLAPAAAAAAAAVVEDELGDDAKEALASTQTPDVPSKKQKRE